MSTPQPFAIDPDHKEMVEQFIGNKAEEDGVVEFNELVDLIFEYWDIVTDIDALEAEVNAMEIDKLEAQHTEMLKAVDEIPKQIAERKKKKKKRKTKKKKKKKKKNKKVERTPREFETEPHTETVVLPNDDEEPTSED